MARSADFVIKGYMYQFHKTLLEILQANADDEITIEGIEDIDLVTADNAIQTIQCKYHEGKNYTPSVIYEALLYMMKDFALSENNIQYVIYAHFSDKKVESRPINLEELEATLASNNSDLQKHIEAIKEKNVDLAQFQEVCKIEFGPSFDELKETVLKRLADCQLPKDSIEEIFYPNAISKIAEYSIQHQESNRKVTKSKFLRDLLLVRKTVISKWTIALKDQKEILSARRKQLKPNLSLNSRNRCFIISNKVIKDFSDKIVIFISTYLSKYHFKRNHDKAPTFYLDCDNDTFSDVCQRLWNKQIRLNAGILQGTNDFDENEFFRPPYRINGRGTFIDDFKIRITMLKSQSNILKSHGFDDIFILSPTTEEYDLPKKDIEIEHLPLDSIEAIYYVLGLKDDII